VAEAYRKLRGTLRFLLGNLADFDPQQHAVPYAQLPAVDRWLLAKHAELMREVAEAYEAYQVGGHLPYLIFTYQGCAAGGDAFNGDGSQSWGGMDAVRQHA
jgi:isoleucyl-tRNA synthetase